VSNVEDTLLVEEYKSCRDLIKTNIEIIEKSEVYAVGAVGAIAVFSLSSSVPIVATVSAWIPLAGNRFDDRQHQQLFDDD
jgi:hypothetical protein